MFYGHNAHHASAHRQGRDVGTAVSDIIAYVKNPEKADGGRLITSFQCDSRTSDAEFLFSKRQYKIITGRTQEIP